MLKNTIPPAFCDGMFDREKYEALDEQSNRDEDQDNAYNLIHSLHFTSIMQELAQSDTIDGADVNFCGE